MSLAKVLKLLLWIEPVFCYIHVCVLLFVPVVYQMQLHGTKVVLK